jgi:hypothetical protein
MSKLLFSKNFLAVTALLCLLAGQPRGAQSPESGSIFDTSQMHGLEIIELHKNGYFKTYFARHGEAMVLVTDYRSTSIVPKGSRVKGTFLFVAMRKVLYRGTQYEMPEYAIYAAENPIFLRP